MKSDQVTWSVNQLIQTCTMDITNDATCRLWLVHASASFGLSVVIPRPTSAASHSLRNRYAIGMANSLLSTLGADAGCRSCLYIWNKDGV